jgi:hypothetical protein
MNFQSLKHYLLLGIYNVLGMLPYEFIQQLKHLSQFTVTQEDKVLDQCTIRSES